MGMLPVFMSGQFKVNGKAIPTTDLDRPRGFLEVEAPRFHDNHHMNVVRFSALC